MNIGVQKSTRLYVGKSLIAILMEVWRINHICSILFFTGVWNRHSFDPFQKIPWIFRLLISIVFQINHQNSTPFLTLNKSQTSPFVHLCAVQIWYLKRNGCIAVADFILFSLPTHISTLLR